MNSIDSSSASAVEASAPPPAVLAENAAEALASPAPDSAEGEAAASAPPPPASADEGAQACASSTPALAEEGAATAASTPPACAKEAAGSASPSPTAAPTEEDAAPRQRGRPFEPGQSGNPNGRPKGSRNRVTLAIEALIHGQGEALGAKAVEKALEGDSSLLRALLRTLVPTRRDQTVEFELPKVETSADVLAASSAVLAACSRGEISPNEASEIMALISTHVRTLEFAELEARLTALEKRVEQ
jgi:hypothetical protein